MTSPDTLQSYEDCKRIVAARLSGEGDAIPLPARRSETVDERLVQCIWQDQLFKTGGLATAGGRSLAIIDPGRWNHEGGPDFLGASIEINGRPVKGDVEIHVNAADWKRHHHHTDFEYNRVILHAVLEATDSSPTDIKHNGATVDRFIMTPHIEPDLETIRRSLNPDDFSADGQGRQGRCANVIRELSDEFMIHYLDMAARERMESKIHRFEDQLVGEPIDQVFYQALMTAMGHKGRKALYFLLAKRAPLTEILDFANAAPPEDRVALAEAILFHVAGLMPEEASESEMDEETRGYIDRLRALWEPARPFFTDRHIPPTPRWRAGVRPVNFPWRRLAGIARLIVAPPDGQSFFRNLSDMFIKQSPTRPTLKSVRALLKSFLPALTVDGHGYWAQRYSYLAKKAVRSMSLIGENSAQSVTLNAFIPLLIAQARRQNHEAIEKRAYSIYRHYPKLQDNSITRAMRARLFDDPARAKRLMTTEARQQALFYLFHDCCDSNEVTCDRCAYITVDQTLSSPG